MPRPDGMSKTQYVRSKVDEAVSSINGEDRPQREYAIRAERIGNKLVVKRVRLSKLEPDA